MHMTKPRLADTLSAMAFAIRAIWSRHRMELADWRAGQRAAAERHRSQPVPVAADIYVPPPAPQPCAVPTEPSVVLTLGEAVVGVLIVVAAVILLAYWVCDTDPVTFMQLLQVEPATAVAIAELFGVAGR